MKKIGKIAVGVVLVATAGVLIVPRFFRAKEIAEPVAPPIVKTEQAEIGTIELATGLIGMIEPSDVVSITPKMPGTVTEVFVNAGDAVKEGQLLCKVDTKQVAGAKITLDASAIALEDARKNLARMQILYESGDISVQAFEQVQSGVKSAALQYDGAKLAYDMQLEYSSITAPIAGVIENIDMEVHDTVAQQNVLCVIAGQGSKALSFSITERVAAYVKTGDSIRIEKNGAEYSGTITQVSAMTDAATGLFKVKASVAGGETLATGTSVKLYVTSDRAEGVMTLPVDVVYYDGGIAYVYTYDAGTVHKVQVETGINDEERIQIISGITP
ncbi:MAG: efflux RND transporter periplasmic adaptor subunit, partial [Hungatella sp.]